MGCYLAPSTCHQVKIRLGPKGPRALRSLLQRESSPPRRPPPPPPTHVGWTQNPVRRALKFSGFVGVQLHENVTIPARIWPQIIQQAQPRLETSLRPSPSARLLACLTCLRRGSPANATHSGPSVYDTGLAHPATRPSTAQPSPPSPSSRHNQQPGPAARQPATHPWLRSLVAETSFSLPSLGPSASQGTPATTGPQLTSRLSPVCQGQVCLTCLRLASGQRPVSRV